MPQPPIAKALIIQHVPFEGPGSILPWLEITGTEVSISRVYLGECLPQPAQSDLLVVMGGPMSVNDESRYPWLAPEKWLIREALQRDAGVLGICLGAQLIASALGAEVRGNPVKEIGWFPIKGVPARDCFGFPQTSTVFHWHGETFDLPKGAMRIAESPACRNQAFQIGKRVMGLQFHLETTPESAAVMIGNCGEELVPGPWIQCAADIRLETERRHSEANSLMGRVLEYLMTVK